VKDRPFRYAGRARLTVTVGNKWEQVQDDPDVRPDLCLENVQRILAAHHDAIRGDALWAQVRAYPQAKRASAVFFDRAVLTRFSPHGIMTKIQLELCIKKRFITRGRTLPPLAWESH
jgi:hypothetical protein